MTNIEDTKQVANDFMRKQLSLFDKMNSLDKDELVEFMKWFGSQPQNSLIKNYAKSLFDK